MNYGKRRGIIDIRVCEARNLKNPNLFGKSDPYAKLSIGSTTHLTNVHNNGNKCPVWDTKLPAMIVGNVDADELSIEIWDKDKATRDDFIGKTTLDLASFVGPENDVKDAWYNIEPRGEIRLRTKFSADGDHGVPSSPPAPLAIAVSPAQNFPKQFVQPRQTSTAALTQQMSTASLDMFKDANESTGDVLTDWLISLSIPVADAKTYAKKFQEDGFDIVEDLHDMAPEEFDTIGMKKGHLRRVLKAAKP